MQEWVARIIGFGSNLFPKNSKFVFLRDYDPLADDLDEEIKIGGGVAYFTEDPNAARAFSADEINAFVTQQHPTMPIRPDGKPNRPLTSFTYEFAPKSKYVRLDGRLWKIAKP